MKKKHTQSFFKEAQEHTNAEIHKTYASPLIKPLQKPLTSHISSCFEIDTPKIRKNHYDITS